MKIDDFLQIEKKYDLYHLEIEGVQPWMYFRMQFWNLQICQELLSLSWNTQVKGKAKRYVDRLKSLMCLMARKNAKKIHKADIIFYSHPRRIKSNGYYECIYTDCLVQKYANSMVLEEPFQNKHLTPVQVKSIYYTDLLQIKAILYGRIQRYLKTKRYKRILRDVYAGFSRPLEEMREAYSFKISSEQVCRELAQIVMEVFILKQELRRVFEKIQPKLLIEVVYYSRYCMILNDLAKEKGIPAVELQHGIPHASHAAYQFPAGCGEIKQFPDYVFLFSDYWKKAAHLPIPDERIKVTGYPYFERQLQKYNSDEIDKDEKKRILFISQGPIGQELGHLAAELCDLLDPKRYHIIYKLHPGEYEGWRIRYPELVKNNIEVIDSLEHSIYEYFSVSAIQVGVYSTAIYEGLGFGLTTYIYDIGYADTMSDLCEQGYAFYVKDVEELFAYIHTADTVHPCNGKNFWKKNALDNICHEIDELLVRQHR